MLLMLPAVVVRFGIVDVLPLVGALTFGLAICAASFLLSWSAEAAQKHLAHGLIIGLVALIVVLPEYAIDMTFSWKAGKDFAEYGGYPIANMTGANRLLIGLGWPMIFFIFWLRSKSRSRPLTLGPTQALELVTIGLATLYAFFIVMKGTLAFYDALILGALFLFYFRVISKSTDDHEVHLIGPAKTLGQLKAPFGHVALILLFLVSALIIFLSADPFGENLIHVGESFGIDRFILIQWIAPLASELPEFIVAGLFVMRISARSGMATLISSKVNQWTLLIGTIPLVFAASAGSLDAFPLDARQNEELFLTAAQSLFAVVLMARLNLTLRGALTLMILFLVQLALPDTTVRYIFSFIYLGLAGGLLLLDRKRIGYLVQQALRAIRQDKNTKTTSQ